MIVRMVTTMARVKPGEGGCPHPAGISNSDAQRSRKRTIILVRSRYRMLTPLPGSRTGSILPPVCGRSQND